MSIIGRPTAQTQQTIKNMKKFDCTADLRRELTAATAGMVTAARTAARSTPSTRSKKSAKSSAGGSLRAAAASAVKRTIKLRGKGVIVAILAVPKGGKSNLVRVLEGEISWQHPVFGNEPAVTQEPHPFFYRTLEAFAPAVSRRVEAAIAKFEKKI